MKILIITPDIYPFQKGYGGRNPLYLFEAFNKMGHSVRLLTSVPAKVYYGINPNEVIKNLEIVRLHSFDFLPDDFQYVSPIYISDVEKVRRILSKEDYDILILNDYFWSLSFLALIFIGRRNRSRIIMVNHGIISPPGYFLKLLFKLFSDFVSRVFIPQFMGILSYSRRSHDTISKIVNRYGKLHVHPSCIDNIKFINDYKKSLLLPEDYLDKKFGISSDFVFSIGAVSSHKGYDVLIKAFHMLTTEYVDLILVIAGQPSSFSGTLKTLAEQLDISNRVKFIGPIEEEEKFFMLRKCSMFAIPSISEGFGAGAMEADILQVKVLATETGSHADILSNNKFAKIITPGDVKGLYGGIKALLSIPDEPKRTLNTEKLNSYSCELLASYILSIAK